MIKKGADGVHDSVQVGIFLFSKINNLENKHWCFILNTTMMVIIVIFLNFQR
jgi:hypothetical protein